MVHFNPLKALTPPTEHAATVAAPPYDVINRQEAREYLQNRPHSILRVTRADALLDDKISLYAPEAYQKSLQEFQTLIQQGYLQHSNEIAYYVYAQRMGQHKQVGIVGLASAEDYWQDRIKKHEFTLPKKEDDRMQQMHTLKAHLGPVFMAYHAQQDIDRCVQAITQQVPWVDFVAEDTVQHQVWKVENPADIEMIQAGFAQVDALYIADGQHRAAAASRVGKGIASDQAQGQFLAVAFPDHQLQILPYNRVVHHLNGHSASSFLQALGEKFDLQEIPQAQAAEHPQQWSMYLEQQWYYLTPKASLKDEIAQRSVTDRLDVSVLQHEILAPLLAVQNPRTATHIDFVGGIRGLSALQQRADHYQGVAFALYPTSIQELMSIADAGSVMPPKSTWFEPKLRSGLVISTFE